MRGTWISNGCTGAAPVLGRASLPAAGNIVPILLRRAHGPLSGNRQRLHAAARLAEAGLSIVFLQFDGVSDQVYEALRGAKLYEEKMRAIENCNRVRTGVTLVPTVVRGVNDQMLGEIIRLWDPLPSRRHWQSSTGKKDRTAA